MRSSTGRAENVAALEGPAGKGKFRLQVGDILNVDAVATAVNEVDRVYHLAAAVGVKLVIGLLQHIGCIEGETIIIVNSRIALITFGS